MNITGTLPSDKVAHVCLGVKICVFMSRDSLARPVQGANMPFKCVCIKADNIKRWENYLSMRENCACFLRAKTVRVFYGALIYVFPLG
jgi:hypothetical protein